LANFLNLSAQGVAQGAIYSLIAMGLVLTYKTSGVFNLAFSAQAFIAGAVFYWLNVDEGVPLFLAFVVAVGVVSPLLGLLLDRAIFRYMRTAPWSVKLVSALGLMLGLPQIILLPAVLGPELQSNPPNLASIVGVSQDYVFKAGEFAIGIDRIIAVVVSLVVVIALGLLFRYSSVGLQMRAVVESPRMVELAGVDADRVSAFSWMLSSFMAGLAGVLLAPIITSVNPSTYILIIVPAVVVACFGRLSSIPLTLAGGIAFGLLEKLIGSDLLTKGFGMSADLVSKLQVSLPFIVLLLLLLFLPGLRTRREAQDPLSGVDPPPPSLAASYKDESTKRLTKIIFPIFIGAFVVVTLFWLSGIWVNRLTAGLVWTIIFLSITVFTGLGGQISLGQTAFALTGAFAVGQLIDNLGMPILLAMVIGALIAALLGALVALPALRLDGLYLTLATLGFALMMGTLIFQDPSVSNQPTGFVLNRPLLWDNVDVFGWFTIHRDFFRSDDGFFLLTLLVFAIVAVAVILVRTGTTGRSLLAVRGSPTAAASIGINSARLRVVLFAVAAAIAAVGGTMYGMLIQNTPDPNGTEFAAIVGAFWIVLVVTVGARTVDGAANAGLSFVLTAWLIESQRLPASLQIIGFGFGAIAYAKHPEGVVEWQTRRGIQDRARNAAEKARVAGLKARGLIPAHFNTRDVGLSAAPFGLYALYWLADGIYNAPVPGLEVLGVAFLMCLPFGLGPALRALRGDTDSRRLAFILLVISPVSIYGIFWLFTAIAKGEPPNIKWFELACALSAAYGIYWFTRCFRDLRAESGRGLGLVGGFALALGSVVAATAGFFLVDNNLFLGLGLGLVACPLFFILCREIDLLTTAVTRQDRINRYTGFGLTFMVLFMIYLRSLQFGALQPEVLGTRILIFAAIGAYMQFLIGAQSVLNDYWLSKVEETRDPAEDIPGEAFHSLDRSTPVPAGAMGSVELAGEGT
jgi:branched-chain amino acid transport system permease protein